MSVPLYFFPNQIHLLKINCNLQNHAESLAAYICNLQNHPEYLAAYICNLQNHPEHLTASFCNLQNHPEHLTASFCNLQNHPESLTASFCNLQNRPERLTAPFCNLQPPNSSLKKGAPQRMHPFSSSIFYFLTTLSPSPRSTAHPSRQGSSPSMSGLVSTYALPSN